ncbi:MAG: hypothetical protein NVSMB19_13780 [Vulcanimicrobiaceae bacterium]
MATVAVNRSALDALVAEVGRFYIRERTMRRAHATMTAALGAGTPLAEADVAAYVAAVERYFGGFEREARAHLRDVDRRLGRVSQLQFNLTAERGVTARRVEVTQGVLARVAELGRR